MPDDNDNLLLSLLPVLQDHISRLIAEREALDAKRNELVATIREVEQKITAIKAREVSATSESGARKPKGANKEAVLNWFREHPGESVGQTEIAQATAISPSSARVVLDRLVEQGELVRGDDGRWRAKSGMKESSPEKQVTAEKNSIFGR